MLNTPKRVEEMCSFVAWPQSIQQNWQITKLMLAHCKNIEHPTSIRTRKGQLLLKVKTHRPKQLMKDWKKLQKQIPLPNLEPDKSTFFIREARKNHDLQVRSVVGEFLKSKSWDWAAHHPFFGAPHEPQSDWMKKYDFLEHLFPERTQPIEMMQIPLDDDEIFQIAHFNIQGKMMEKLAPTLRYYHILFHQNSPDVVIFSETFTEKDLPNISGYQMICCSHGNKQFRTHRSSGMAVYVKRSIATGAFKPVFMHPKFCLQVYKLNTSPPTHIITGYSPPSNSVNFDRLYFDTLREVLADYNLSSTYLIGDFNARLGPLTNDMTNDEFVINPSGILLEPIISEFGLTILNPTEPAIATCPNNTDKGSIIDLALSFNGAAPVTSFNIPQDDVFRGDHRPIIFSFVAKCNFSRHYPPDRFTLPRTIPKDRRNELLGEISRQTLLARDFIGSIPEYISIQDRSELATLALNCVYWFSLIDAVGLHRNPSVTTTIKIDAKVAFLDERIQLLVDTIRIDPLNAHNLEHLEKLRKELKDHLSEHHQQRLHLTLNRIQKTLPSTAMKTIKKATNSSWTATPLYLRFNEKWTPANEAFTEFYKQQWTAAFEGDPEHDQIVFKSVDEFFEEEDDEVFEFEEAHVMKAIRRLRRKAAPGFNGISTRILFETRHYSLSFLTEIFNLWTKSRKVPDFELSAKVFALVKNPDKNSEPSHFRPISLLSVFYKIYEYMLHDIYLVHSNKMGIPHSAQFGFRKGRSIQEPLFQIRAISEIIKMAGNPLFLLSMDISKAFDKVWRPGILHKLIKYDFPPILIHMIRAIFSSTSASVVLQFQSLNFFETTSGTQQGGVLSPSLFSLLLHDLSVALMDIPNDLRNEFFRGPDFFNHLLFADDLLLFALSKEGLEHLLRVTEEYAFHWHFKFSPLKSFALDFNVDPCSVLQTGPIDSEILEMQLEQWPFSEDKEEPPDCLKSKTLVGYCGWKYFFATKNSHIDLNCFLFDENLQNFEMQWIPLNEIPPSLRPDYDYQSMQMNFEYPKSFLDEWKTVSCSSNLFIHEQEIPLTFGLRYLGTGLFAHGDPSILGSTHSFAFMHERYFSRIQGLLAMPFSSQDFSLQLNFLSTFIQCFSNLYHQFLPYSSQAANFLDRNHANHLRKLLKLEDDDERFYSGWTSLQILTGRVFPFYCWIKARLLFHFKLCSSEHPLFNFYLWLRENHPNHSFILETQDLLQKLGLEEWWDPEDWPEPPEDDNGREMSMTKFILQRFNEAWSETIWHSHAQKHPHSPFKMLEFKPRKKPFWLPLELEGPKPVNFYKLLLNYLPMEWHVKENHRCTLCRCTLRELAPVVMKHKNKSMKHLLFECCYFDSMRKSFMRFMANFCLEKSHYPNSVAPNTHVYCRWLTYSSKENDIYFGETRLARLINLFLMADEFPDPMQLPKKVNRPRKDCIFKKTFEMSCLLLDRVLNLKKTQFPLYFVTTPFKFPPCDLHLFSSKAKGSYKPEDFLKIRNHFSRIMKDLPPKVIVFYSDASFSRKKKSAGGIMVFDSKEGKMFHIHFPLPVISANFAELLTVLFAIRYIKFHFPEQPVVGIIDSQANWNTCYSDFNHYYPVATGMLHSLLNPRIQIHAIPSHTIFRYNHWVDAIADLDFKVNNPIYTDISTPDFLPTHFIYEMSCDHLQPHFVPFSYSIHEKFCITDLYCPVLDYRFFNSFRPALPLFLGGLEEPQEGEDEKTEERILIVKSKAKTSRRNRVKKRNVRVGNVGSVAVLRERERQRTWEVEQEEKGYTPPPQACTDELARKIGFRRRFRKHTTASNILHSKKPRSPEFCSPRNRDEDNSSNSPTGFAQAGGEERPVALEVGRCTEQGANSRRETSSRKATA